jgi:glyoxylase-like metal-dependent hydrolase (beta-lactamase superfamily II)
MHFGEIEVLPIHAGNFYLDGGAMFGVVPKTLWEKKSPADEKNRIRLAANSLLLRTRGKNILVETGNGTKWDPKLRGIYGIQDGDPLTESLARVGVAPENIDMVINTHLHFDHGGGNTRHVDGRDVPAFPKAKYVVQRCELEHAMHPTERDRASYFEDRIVPITAAGHWELVEGDADILPGVSVVRIPGHNADIQAVKISSGGRALLYVADLLPTRHHLPLAWMTGYDLYPLQTLETKRRRIAEMIEHGWIVAFGHDPDFPAATLHESGSKIEFEPVDLNK